MTADDSGTPMTADDLPAVVALEARLQAFPWTLGNFRDALQSGYDCRLWRGTDGTLLAYAVVLHVLDEAHLLVIGVAPETQRQGIATAAMRQLCTAAAARGATQFFLEVRVSNAPAIGLYQKLGFVPLHTRRRYYPAPDGAREDALVMHKALP